MTVEISAAETSTRYWDNLNELVQSHRIVIDRPKGTAHPRYLDFPYPLDYGYLDGTSGGDGREIDVWVGSGSRSLLTGVVCTVDLHKRDTEVKLLLGCTEEEVAAILNFTNEGSMRGVLLRR